MAEKLETPAVCSIVPESIRAYLWRLFDESGQSIPQFFDLDRSRSGPQQRILHMIPGAGHFAWHIAESMEPLDGLRLAVIMTRRGDFLLKVRNQGVDNDRSLDPSFSNPSITFQGSLFE